MASKQLILLKSELSRMGGAEKIASRLGNAFFQRGFPVTILTTGAVSPSSSFKIVSHKYKSRMSVLKVREYDYFCQQLIAKQKEAIVFGLDRNSFQTHLRASNGVHAAYLNFRGKTEGSWKKLSFSLNPLHRFHLHLEKKAFEHPLLQKLFTNSHLIKRQILHFYNVDPKKIEVVHNGVEWEEFNADFQTWSSKKREIANQLRLDPDVYQFLFIGHNFKRKGLEIVLHALKKFPSKNFQLSVVGKDKNLSFYLHLVKQLGLESQVHFFGARSDTRPFYQLADCLIIPSLYDPFANVTLEALAMGLFVISSKTNGASEILTSRNGTVIEDLFSPDALEASLKIAFRNPKTAISAAQIRESVKRFEFSLQLQPFINACIT